MNTFATYERLLGVEGEMLVVDEARRYLEMRSNLSDSEKEALQQLEVRYEYLYAMKVGIERVMRGY